MTTLFNDSKWWSYSDTTWGKWLIEYESQRSGANMQYRFHWKFWLGSQYSWFYNALKMPIYLNGTNVETIQVKYYKEEKGWVYEGTTGWYTVSNKLSGNVPVYFEVIDTGGSYQTEWDKMATSSTYNLPVITPSAPSKPSSISIPSSAAPDQTVTISWSASSGGTNGVSGYRLAYSKDGGSNWSYKTVTGTSTTLNLNDLGFVHGSKLKCGVQSYSTVGGTNYYSDFVYSGTTTTNFVAPSAPSTITIPSSIAPDKTASISWSSASGGTNGVKGYEWQWSNDGGNTWPGTTNTTGTTGSLNLNSNGFKHGSRLMARVRAYTTGQGTKYYSSWKTSGYTVTNFIAPSAPRSVALSTNMPEPIPTGTYNGSWLAPTSTGSNGISGYRVQWLKNGSNLGSEVDASSTSASKALTESTIQPGDILSFKVRAYTIGQSTRYYSDYTASTSIEIVSDKFIYLSQNGGTFTKYKAFISVNGGSFKEIKKEKLKVIR